MRLNTRLFLAVAAPALLAGPLAATGISYVTTFTSIFSGSVFDNYDSATGLSGGAGSCFLAAGGTGPCATLSSDPATNQLGLTASSTAILNGVAFDPQNGASGYGDASAAASLATGILRAYVNGPNCSPPNGSGCDSGGSATAQMQDSLSFTNTTGSTVDIGVGWSFDGSIVPQGTFPNTNLTTLFCFAPGTVCGGNPNGVPHGPLNAGQSFIFAEQNGAVTQNVAPTTAGWVSTSITAGANSTSETFHGIFAIPPGISSDTLNAYIQVNCLIATCDFSHTGAFTLDSLPSGVSFTSGSGALLTAETPEPATWPLALCGIALLAVKLTGRKSTHGTYRAS